MRRTRELIKKARENGRRRAVRSNAVQRDARLAAALDRCAPTDYMVFELATCNPRTGLVHYLEIYHEAYGGNNRYAVYLDGDRWRNGWSRSRFCSWIFNQIDSVVRSFS